MGYIPTVFIYAGIDEAGYGPLLGPLLVGRFAFAIPKLDADAEPPYLWQRLSKAVCRNLSGRRGRIAVNDSKKLTTAAAGIKHLETGCLAFAGLAGHKPAALDGWLDALGETSHHTLTALPWYAPCKDRPWEPLPHAVTAGEIAIARNLLRRTAERIGIEAIDLGATVCFEDRFNRMVSATRSKAAINFTFVAAHLQHLWEKFGEHHPTVVVDRQSGRSRYRELLAMNFPETTITVFEETPQRSAYRIEADGRALNLSFEVEAEQRHMPVALASMIAKYTRELMMTRFNAYFRVRLPGFEIKPTAGYTTDGRRWLDEVETHLPSLGVTREQLCRIA